MDLTFAEFIRKKFNISADEQWMVADRTPRTKNILEAVTRQGELILLPIMQQNESI